MNPYRDREIATTGAPLVPFDFLQSLFVAELIRPSRRLWISSPWISDVEIVDNRARQFGTLCPDWPATRIRLTRVLESGIRVDFRTPQWAVTPGQSVVLYDGEVCLGGGVIT